MLYLYKGVLRMRRFLVLLLIAGLWGGFFASEAQSAVSDAAVLFLRIAPNARAAGMGEALLPSPTMPPIATESGRPAEPATTTGISWV
jgi:hypothetical protein